MASLISRDTLGIWTRTTIAPDDDYATLVLEGASLKVRQATKHYEWTETGVEPGAVIVPEAAALTVAMLATRVYLNGVNGVKSRTIGPISKSIIEAFAAGLVLTDQEKAELEEFIETSDSAKAGFYVQRFQDPEAPPDVIYVYDIDGGDWGIPWIDITEDTFAVPTDV